MSNSWTKETSLTEMGIRKHESDLATLEILADRHLATRLRKIAKRIDADVLIDKLHTKDEVFGKK
jgi:hypothetical protein